jgi:hypothetical protein
MAGVLNGELSQDVANPLADLRPCRASRQEAESFALRKPAGGGAVRSSQAGRRRSRSLPATLCRGGGKLGFVEPWLPDGAKGFSLGTARLSQAPHHLQIVLAEGSHVEAVLPDPAPDCAGQAILESQGDFHG